MRSFPMQPRVNKKGEKAFQLAQLYLMKTPFKTQNLFLGLTSLQHAYDEAFISKEKLLEQSKQVYDELQKQIKSNMDEAIRINEYILARIHSKKFLGSEEEQAIVTFFCIHLNDQLKVSEFKTTEEGSESVRTGEIEFDEAKVLLAESILSNHHKSLKHMTAVQKLEYAVEQKYIPAFPNLAVLYGKGIYVQKDERHAYDLIHATYKTDNGSLIDIAVMALIILDHNWEVETSVFTFAKLLLDHADVNSRVRSKFCHPEGCYQLAMEIKKRGGEHNIPIVPFLNAAILGTTPANAQLELGLAYIFGNLGLTQNQEHGRKLIHEACRQKNLPAYIVASLLELGGPELGNLLQQLLLVFLKDEWQAHFKQMSETEWQESETKDFLLGDDEEFNFDRAALLFMKPAPIMQLLIRKVTNDINPNSHTSHLLRFLTLVLTNPSDAYKELEFLVSGDNVHAHYILAKLILFSNGEVAEEKSAALLRGNGLLAQCIHVLATHAEVRARIKELYNNPISQEFALDVVKRYQQLGNCIPDRVWTRAFLDSAIFLSLKAIRSIQEEQDLEFTIEVILRLNNQVLKLQLAANLLSGKYFRKDPPQAYQILTTIFIDHTFLPGIFIKSMIMHRLFGRPLETQCQKLAKNPEFNFELELVDQLLANETIVQKFKEDFAVETAEKKSEKSTPGKKLYEDAILMLAKENKTQHQVQQSIKKIETAARQKYPPAQIQYACMLIEGLGVKQNLGLAYELICESERAGDVEANRLIAAILSKLSGMTHPDDSAIMLKNAEILLQDELIKEKVRRDFVSPKGIALAQQLILKRSINAVKQKLDSEQTEILLEFKNTQLEKYPLDQLERMRLRSIYSNSCVDEMQSTSPEAKFELAEKECQQNPDIALQLIQQAALLNNIDAKRVLVYMLEIAPEARNKYANWRLLKKLSTLTPQFEQKADGQNAHLNIAQSIIFEPAVLCQFDAACIVYHDFFHGLTQEHEEAEAALLPGNKEFSMAMQILNGTLTPSSTKRAEAISLLWIAVKCGYTPAKYQLAISNAVDELVAFNLIIEAANEKSANAIALLDQLKSSAKQELKSSITEELSCVQRLLSNGQVLDFLQHHPMQKLQKNAVRQGSHVIASQLTEKLKQDANEWVKFSIKSEVKVSPPFNMDEITKAFIVILSNRNVIPNRSSQELESEFFRADNAECARAQNKMNQLCPMELKFYDRIHVMQNAQETIKTFWKAKHDENVKSIAHLEGTPLYNSRCECLKNEYEVALRTLDTIVEDYVMHKKKIAPKLSFFSRSQASSAPMESERKLDLLLPIKKVLDLVYNQANYTVLELEDLKRNASILKECPRTPEFWCLICEGVMKGNGREFIDTLRELGFTDPLFGKTDTIEWDYIASRVDEMDQALAEHRELGDDDQKEVPQTPFFVLLIQKEFRPTHMMAQARVIDVREKLQLPSTFMPKLDWYDDYEGVDFDVMHPNEMIVNMIDAELQKKSQFLEAAKARLRL